MEWNSGIHECYMHRSHCSTMHFDICFTLPERIDLEKGIASWNVIPLEQHRGNGFSSWSVATLADKCTAALDNRSELGLILWLKTNCDSQWASVCPVGQAQQKCAFLEWDLSDFVEGLHICTNVCYLCIIFRASKNKNKKLCLISSL